MNNKTLLIMAAGMGSRFGGLKQIEPMGPNGEFIIDYSIYDAKRAGFNKVVFVIKEENYDLFKETIGSRVEPHIKTEYVFQNNDLVPEEYQEYVKNRAKPLGTGHAILCAKNNIHEPFAVINADDFYGKESYMKAASILENLKTTEPYEYAMVGYEVKNTMTENGAVKRGICKVVDQKLSEITECSIEKQNGKIIATPLEGNEESFEIGENAIVSMNLLLFTPSFFTHLEKEFLNFLENNKDNLENSKAEFFIPDAMFAAIKQNYASVRVEETTSKWYGVTYPEDAESVREALKNKVETGEYPNHLWNE